MQCHRKCLAKPATDFCVESYRLLERAEIDMSALICIRGFCRWRRVLLRRWTPMLVSVAVINFCLVNASIEWILQEDKYVIIIGWLRWYCSHACICQCAILWVIGSHPLSWFLNKVNNGRGSRLKWGGGLCMTHREFLSCGYLTTVWLLDCVGLAFTDMNILTRIGNDDKKLFLS